MRRRFKERLMAAWKFCLSFRKKDWEFSDYPVVVRERSKDEPSGPTYYARVVNWIIGEVGNTPSEALGGLQVAFEKAREERLRLGKPMPRPGSNAPIEFVSDERVSANPELRDEFIDRVLGLSWAFVSDESSLGDFHKNETNDQLHAKVFEVYGVDVSDIESGNLADILDRIAKSK